MSSSRKTSRTGTRGYAQLVEIDVPLARVWRALTDPGLIKIWSAQEAEVDPRKGGVYRIGRPQAGGREAHIDIFDVNRRLRLIYLKAPHMPASESAIVDDFLIDVRQGTTTASLRLLGSGVSEAAEWDKAYMKMRMSWERFLGRIKVTLESPPMPKPPEPVKDPGLRGLDF